MESSLNQLRTTVERIVDLHDEDWSHFSQDWVPFSFEKGEMVTIAGDTEKYFYFVKEGLIRGFFLKDGNEYNIGFSYKGDFSGVFDSFVLQKPSEWSLEALSETSGLKVTYEQFNDLLERNPKFERWARIFYQQALVGFGVFVRSLLADTAEEKYRKLIARSPHVIQMIPQKHLASYLGMSPETFSRLRAKIRD